MKLYIKQKNFSWVDRFTIKDENGQDKYYVEGEMFSFGKKLHIFDMGNVERAFIQQDSYERIYIAIITNNCNNCSRNSHRIF